MKTWTEDTQRRILSAYRSGLLTGLPIDPAIFGSYQAKAAPFQRERLAEMLVDYFNEYKVSPSPEVFLQLVSDKAEGLDPVLVEGLKREAEAILETVVPPGDLPFLTDRVREAIGFQMIRRAIITVRDLVGDGEFQEGSLPKLQEIMAKAIQPIARDLGGQWGMLYDAAKEWDFEPITFAVEGLLPSRGVVWVSGKPKQGKSLLFLYLSLALHANRPSIAGSFTIRQRPRILYIAAEDGGERIKDRRADILSTWKGAGIEKAKLTFLIKPKGLDLADRACVDELKRRCAELKVEMLVLDTWTRLSPNADPMNPRDQLVVTQAVLELAELVPLVVIVDHSRKNRPDGQALSPADILGPSQKWQNADWTIMLEESGSKRRLEVYVEGKDGDESRFYLNVSPRGSGGEKFTYGGSVERLAEASQRTGANNREAVSRALQAFGATGATAKEIVMALGNTLSERAVQRHLGDLVKIGFARPDGKGKKAKYYAVEVESP